MFNGIRRRLVAWNVLVLGLLLAVVSGVMYLTLAHSLLAAVDQNLAGRGDQAGSSTCWRRRMAGSWPTRRASS